MVKGKFYWHTQRDVLFGISYNYRHDVEDIQNSAIPHERSTRLRLFKPIKGPLPEVIQKANAECERLYNLWLKACEVNREARKAHMAKMEALHAKECGCKEWNGKEIVFPLRKAN